ncbi:MAG: cytochrome P450 [Parvularculaceae bacterium]
MSETRAQELYPQCDIDLFAPDALKDPFPLYKTIRDLGPVVWLSRVGAAAISRFEDVQMALRSADALISGEGIGFNRIANHQTAERGVLTSDGERHQKLRSVLARPLGPGALRERREMLKSLIDAQVASLVGGETFDAVPALARHLPLKAVTALVGLDEEGRAKMLDWAAAFFNTLAPIPENDADFSPALRADLDLLRDLRDFFAGVDPDCLAPGSWSADLFNAVGEGRLTESEARGALRAFVIPSLDTTIYAKANLLFNLARHKEQWRRLKEDRSLISSAIIESVRHSAVVRAFSRFAAEDYSADNVFLKKGTRVMVMFGSANRDERRYKNPDAFDVARNPRDQLGWGTGPHMCVGMHLAKLEMELLLEALLDNVEAIEADAPEFGVNAGLYGIDRLPMRLR